MEPLVFIFGFPTEEKHEAQETIDFTVQHSELGDGTIHSVGQSIFSLEKDSAIYHNPAKFQINRILRDPERDMAIIFDYEIEKGMSKDEVLDVYESFEKS